MPAEELGGNTRHLKPGWVQMLEYFPPLYSGVEWKGDWRASGRDEHGYWLDVRAFGRALRMRWIWCYRPQTAFAREGFWIAMRPCNRWMWHAVLGAEPVQNWVESEDWLEEIMTDVPWGMVVRFVQAANEQLPFGIAVGLPTPAQWAQAAQQPFMVGMEDDVWEWCASEPAEKGRCQMRLDIGCKDVSMLRSLLADNGSVRPSHGGRFRMTIAPVCLTRRETEVLKWIMVGKTNWEVGQSLGLSETTIIRHLQRAMAKLHVSTKHQAVIKALGYGLI